MYTKHLSCLVINTAGNMFYMLFHGSIGVHPTPWGYIGLWVDWSSEPDNQSGLVQDYTSYSYGMHITAMGHWVAYWTQDKWMCNTYIRQKNHLYYANKFMWNSRIFFPVSSSKSWVPCSSKSLFTNTSRLVATLFIIFIISFVTQYGANCPIECKMLLNFTNFFYSNMTG